MAPVLPALTKASPRPSAKALSPTARELCLYSFRISVGSAQTGITMGASMNSKPEISFSSQILRISASFPTATMSTPSSFAAIAAPRIGAFGALSPPYISIITFIKPPPNRQWLFRQARHSARPCGVSSFQAEAKFPYLRPWAENCLRFRP